MNSFIKIGLLAGVSLVALDISSKAQQIPSFPPVTTPLNGSEQTYVVQSGGSKNATMNQLATFMLPTTANLTSLRLACTGLGTCPAGSPVYKNGVIRLTDGVAGAPNEIFLPVSGTCSTNGLNNDGGSCSSSADNESWVGQFPIGPRDIRQWGGKNDGSADVSAAFSAALASNPNPNIYFPGGIYLFTSPITYNSTNGASISIVGDGRNQSIIFMHGPSNGWTFNLNSTVTNSSTTVIHVQDTGFTTDQKNTILGILIDGVNNTSPHISQSDFINVSFSASDSGQLSNFLAAIDILDDSFFNFNGLYITGAIGNGQNSNNGIGVELVGDSAYHAKGLTPVVYNFNNSLLSNLGNDIVMGDWVQGIQIVNSNFNGNVGIYAPTGAGGTGRDQIYVSNSQFGAGAGPFLAMYIQGNDVTNVSINNSLFILPDNSTAIEMNSSQGQDIISGNIFRKCCGTGTATSGILMVGSTGSALIDISNNLFQNDVGGSSLLTDIDFGSVANANASLNHVGANTVPFANSNGNYISYYDASNQLIVAGPKAAIGFHFGSGDSLSGTNTAGRLTVGTGGAVSGSINFGGGIHVAPPVCAAQDEITPNPLRVDTNTVGFTIYGTMLAGDTVTYQCQANQP